MGALQSYPPPPMAVEPARARAKALPIAPALVAAHVEHIRSPKKRAGRTRSRELLKQGLTETRCLVDDVAEALDVAPRVAGRAVDGSAPFDLGDVLTLAEYSRGSLRTARRVVALLSAELDRIESSFHK